MRPQYLALTVTRAVIPIIIQADFANRDQFFRARQQRGQFFQPGCR